MPQLKAAIRELQAQGYALPDYPDEPADAREEDLKARYDRTKGSAVNPVLREGNSDRRAPLSVKQYARKHPHRMGAWSADSKSHVAHMDGGDFYGSEQSALVAQAGKVKIELLGQRRPPQHAQDRDRGAGRRTDRRRGDEHAGSSPSFVDAQIDDAQQQGVLFSLHLKATMMKVSDPIMFGIVVKRFYRDVLDKHAAALDAGRLRSQQRHRRPVRAPAAAAGRGPAPRSRPTSPRCTHAPGAGDGQFRQGHHQPARAQRRDRRRVDAGDDPRLRPHVERGRQAAGHQGGDPGPLLRRRVPGGDRRLQGARRVRSGDHGQRAQRRPDGAEGRGIRLARQDLPDPRRRHRARHRRRRQRADGARGRGRRHLAHVPDQGRADPGLGEAGGVARAAVRTRRRCSGSTRRARTTRR